MILWPFAILTTLFGACVGSFLNVVIYRLPEGLSIVRPPSNCPKCRHRLAAYDNVPVFGWMWLRGKCRYCRNPISVQYPIIEAFTAIMFLVFFVSYYVPGGRPGFSELGSDSTMVFLLHLMLLAALIGGSKIDANLYIIPLEIPWTIIGLAVVMLPLAAAFFPASWSVMPHAPALNQWGYGAAFGGVIGLVASEWLRARGVLPTSFLEPETDVVEVKPAKIKSKEDKASKARSGEESKLKQNANLAVAPSESSANDVPLLSAKMKALAVVLVAVLAAGAWLTNTLAGRIAAVVMLWGAVVVLIDFGAYGNTNTAEEQGPDSWWEHPTPRGEAFKELLYLFMPIAGAIGGAALTVVPNIEAALLHMPLPLKALAGLLFGFLVGGGIVWATRILGTLLFGKEAMGLGDVHLLAAVGAVLGWSDVTLVFFIAPFLGIAGAVVTLGVSKIWKDKARVIPYGPYLAIATILIMLFQGPIYGLVMLLMYGKGYGLPPSPGSPTTFP